MGGEAKIVGRMESYSCKMITTEKQFYKKFAADSGRTPHTLEALSPPGNGYGGYIFSDTKAEEFTKEPSLQFVCQNVDNLLSVAASSQYSKIHDKLWVTLNNEINLLDCDIYSYNPDLTSDPFGEDGSLWSFNYFFFNKKLKRIVLFTCRALTPFSQSFYEEARMEEYEMEEV